MRSQNQEFKFPIGIGIKSPQKINSKQSLGNRKMFISIMILRRSNNKFKNVSLKLYLCF